MIKRKSQFNKPNNNCQVCLFDNDMKVLATYDLEIIDWNKGNCTDHCSIMCTIIHDEPIKKTYYLCRTHYLQMKREEKEIDIQL